MIYETSDATVAQVASLQRFDLITSDSVVDWAATKINGSDTDDCFVEIASLRKPVLRHDISGFLDGLLEKMGERPLSDERAGWQIARYLCAKIVNGFVEPRIGSGLIWWDVAVRVPNLMSPLTTFGGLSSEWDDSPDFRAIIDARIIEAARNLVKEESVS